MFRWSMMALVGVGGGMILGEFVVGKRAGGLSDEAPSYSQLSANPDALVQQGNGAASCPGCADSYGVAHRLRADRDERMNDEFRELGAVDLDPPLPADPVEDYRFGGGFPDPEPQAPDTPALGNDLPTATPPSETSPADIAAPPPANY